MTKDEVLKLALEALEEAHYKMEHYQDENKREQAITAIKQALAAPVQKGAIGAAYQKSPWDGKGTSMPPPEAPVQDSTCNNTLRTQGKAYPRTCKKCGLGPCIALANAALDKKAENARELGLDYEPVQDWKWHQAPVKTSWGHDMVVADLAIDKDNTVSVYCERDQTAKVEAMFTPPAAPDLQAELDATNRQVEILSDALAESRREVARLKAVQEPEYWNVIDPAGNIVASETDAIRGWARIAGSYKPTVEGLLGFHDQGWRVLPKATPPAAQRQWMGLTDEEKRNICRVGPVYAPDGVVTRRPLEYREELEGVALMAVRKAEAKLKEKNT